MRSIGIPMDDKARTKAAAELQTILVDLSALAMNGKQLHWHVVGKQFVPFHEQLDLIIATARTGMDEVAERSITLGVPVDGRPQTVGKEVDQPELPEGWIEVPDAVAVYAELIEGVVGRARKSVKVLEVEPVSQDLVIGILGTLEKHLWMLQAQLEA